MKLYLVQHGEACAEDVDPERPLTAQGRADVERLAAFLQQAGIQVGRVIHSGKLRAAQTAACLAGAIAPGVTPETGSHLNPNDEPKDFDWQTASQNQDTLIAGHLPFLARLVAYLVTGDDRQAITAYRPGSIVCLEQTDAAPWQIAWMIRPELLQ